MLFEPPAEYGSKTPNLSPNIVKHLKNSFGKTPTPEEIFFYIYAILYANIYRTKYAEFLRSDFPRVPFTKKPELFSNMATHGKRLAQLHLLQSSDLNPPIAKFRGKGEGIVEMAEGSKRKNSVNGRYQALLQDYHSHPKDY
jgi:predicted helicase